MNLRKFSVHSCVLAALVLSLAGCGGKSNKDYIPEANTARRALETALAAWQNGATAGQPIETSTSGKMVVELFDGDWSSGKQLTQFEILSEVAEEEGPRQFSVKLSIAGEPEQSATYFVAGIKSRYSVFRDKEYQQRSLQM